MAKDDADKSPESPPEGAREKKGGRKGGGPKDAAAGPRDAAPEKKGAAREGAEAAGEKPPRGKPAGEKTAARRPAAQAAEEGPKRKERGRPARKPSKRFRKMLEMKPTEPLPLGDAVKALKKMGGGLKFDQSVNIAMWLGIDPKQAEQAIRGAISLPHGIGKARRVVCFAEGEDAEKAKAAGAIEVGADDLIAKVSGGWQDFDVAIAHPRLMGKVGKLGRTLGPSGKMPSPKNGTVTPDVGTAVKEFAAGKVEFRNDTGGNVHGVVGKMSFPDADLAANIDAFIDHIRRMKPASSKGTYIKRACISGTMTPSVELNIG